MQGFQDCGLHTCFMLLPPGYISAPHLEKLGGQPIYVLLACVFYVCVSLCVFIWIIYHFPKPCPSKGLIYSSCLINTCMSKAFVSCKALFMPSKVYIHLLNLTKSIEHLLCARQCSEGKSSLLLYTPNLASLGSRYLFGNFFLLHYLFSRLFYYIETLPK